MNESLFSVVSVDPVRPEGEGEEGEGEGEASQVIHIQFK